MGTVFKRGEFWYYNLRNEHGKRMRLFQELTTPWYLMPISMLAVYTGMRRGDDNLIGGVVGLQWDDVDLDARVIHLPTTKNDEPLMVPLSKTVIALLENLPRTSDRLFPGINGNMVTMAFRRACKRAKVTNFRFHDLRHSFGSYLAMAGYNQRTIQELMGHKDPRMTVIYTQLSEQHKRQAIEGLDEILNRTTRHWYTRIPEAPVRPVFWRTSLYQSYVD